MGKVLRLVVISLPLVFADSCTCADRSADSAEKRVDTVKRVDTPAQPAQGQTAERPLELAPAPPADSVSFAEWLGLARREAPEGEADSVSLTDWLGITGSESATDESFSLAEWLGFGSPEELPSPEVPPAEGLEGEATGAAEPELASAAADAGLDDAGEALTERDGDAGPTDEELAMQQTADAGTEASEAARQREEERERFEAVYGLGSAGTGYGIGAASTGIGSGRGFTGTGSGEGSTGIGSGSRSTQFGSGEGFTGVGSGAGSTGFGSGRGDTGYGSGSSSTGVGSGSSSTGFGSGSGSTGVGSGSGFTGQGSGQGDTGFGSGSGFTGVGLTPVNPSKNTDTQ